MTLSLSEKATFNNWCCTASTDDKNNVEITPIYGYDPSDNPFVHIQGKTFDLTDVSEWMEYLERKENRIDDEGGAGAYDALRSDLILHAEASNRWRVWGEDFHLERLKNSYKTLLSENGDGTSSSERELLLQQAEKLSRSVLSELLAEAERSQILYQSASKQAPWEDVEIQLLRIFLLWSPNQNAGQHVIVRGHATSSAQPLLVHRPVDPIVVTVAALGHDHQDARVDASIPTRYRNPQSKVARWVRLRKKLEDPTKYKPPGVSEVLLVRPVAGDGLEVLEGLSSNFFVIYNDNTIRTAQEGVLYGYVRQLVLVCAETCGLKLDKRPILLQDAKEGLWKEAFITSSTRLIFPISKMLIHAEEDGPFEEIWHYTVTTEKPKWRELLDEILTKGGYPRFC
jgi:hypothetical protein